jgi:hypothetical protein
MYQHTQRNRGILLLYCLAALIPLWLLLTRVASQTPLGVRLTILVATLIMITSGFVFSSFTVTIRDGQLQWWFGPRVMRKSVPISGIARVEPTTTSLISGVGVHPTMRGWLYNVGGRRAVLVTLRDGKRFLLGTDEPERLADAIAAATHPRR